MASEGASDFVELLLLMSDIIVDEDNDNDNKEEDFKYSSRIDSSSTGTNAALSIGERNGVRSPIFRLM
jgi:hypothetical protein